MTGSTIDPRDFGRLESEVEALSDLVRSQTTAMANMSARLDTMNATLSEARGGWKTLMLIGGAAAGLGSAISWALAHIKVTG